MYRQGYYGNGTNIGIIDFYGDPERLQQIAYFDRLYNLPPAKINIVPIGPYEPNLGIISGWAIEESLDVEAVHSMAPYANITIYNPSVGDLATIIGYVDQQNKVDVVSMSFGISESEIEYYSSFLLPMIIQTEYYFMIGSLEGITFVASSGDGGGELYSFAQPLADTSYPAVSPFVTSVGGTTTYLSDNSSIQEAWSCSPGGGGSTGGVSVLFPKPWYQGNLSEPFSSINGRMTPDIALNANIYPGVYVVLPGNSSILVGGTSESSQLFAGLLSLLISKFHNRLGLLNPSIYYLAQKYYNKAFYPITFGYNSPWIAKYGYNLVTGWGAPNIGYWSILLSNISSRPALEINISVSPPLSNYFDGNKIQVIANISYKGNSITNGTFYAIIESLNSEEVYPLHFNGTSWIGNITLNNVSGIVYVIVNGSYNGIEGVNLISIFVGYLFTITQAYQYNVNNTTITSFTGCIFYLNGSLATNVKSFPINLYYYNPLTNKYVYETNVNMTLALIRSRTFFFNLYQWEGETNYTLQYTATLITGRGQVYGYLPVFLGINSVGSYILSPVLASPITVSPNESILIEDLGLSLDYVLLGGYNVSASLISPNGKIISSVMLSSQYELIPPYLYITVPIGYLYVPPNTKPGYYTIYLNVTGMINNESILVGYEGFQIYVAPYEVMPIVKITNYAFQGQNVTFYANITYPNGSEVNYGIFTALVFPKQVAGDYSSLSQSLSVSQVMLTYNPKLNEWEGSVILPSINDLGNLTYLNSGYYTGDFQVYVEGLSYNGIPTTTALSNAKSFVVLPYTLIENQNLDSIIPVNSVLENDNITYNGTLENVIMLGLNRLHGNVNLIDDNISGKLIIYDSNITMIGGFINNITAVNSTLNIISSTLYSINLINSKVHLISSKVIKVSPQLPTISLTTPQGNYTGVINVTANVVGINIDNVTFYLNGVPIYTSRTNGTITFQLDTSKYPDGNYKLTVIAYQTDGLYASYTININFYNNLKEVKSDITTLSSNISNVSNELDNYVTILSSKAMMDEIIGIIGIVVGIVAIIIAVLLTRRRK
ncbi:peptidase S53 [Sulfolobus sp. A20-N-G8]|nr:peptidase S53 [Sulfolobus sp. A20-N-G8]